MKVKIPKRVEIVGVDFESEYYEQFIGQQYDVIEIMGDGRIGLGIQTSDGLYPTSYWETSEVKVLEWEESEVD